MHVIVMMVVVMMLVHHVLVHHMPMMLRMHFAVVSACKSATKRHCDCGQSHGQSSLHTILPSFFFERRSDAKAPR
jgi:hypothetical protein